MVGCWAIWEARNRVVFEGSQVEVGDITKRVWDVMEEIEGAWAEATGGGKEGGKGLVVARSGGWQAPTAGWLELNVDAGVKEGVGAVCRDDIERVLWGLSIQRREEWNPQIAEAVAVLDGLEEAARVGHGAIMVESDCLEVLEAFKQRRTRRSLFFLILDDILNFCSSFRVINWSHVSCTHNKVAHAPAHVLLVAVGKTVWIGKLPDVVDCLIG
ncbi:uncharacterized protein LOC141641404 [Silene latifolia]|uniref:uncharacterized protein LOC141641404 n=1 Tax=Silene latifolia TaxID=37657 RepID=UPI003D77FB08